MDVDRPSPTRRRPAWLSGLLAVGLALFAANRLPAIDRDFWMDEVFSVDMARQPLDRIADHVARHDTHPPLYYTLLGVWIRLGGGGETWVRLLSVLLGLVAAAAFGGVAHQLAGRCAGWIAFALVAVTWPLVQASVEARNYILMTACGALAWWCAVRALRTGRWTAWLGVGLALGAAAYAFYYALHVAIAVAAFALAARPSKRTIVGLGLAAAVALAVIAPWLPSLLMQWQGVSGREGADFARLSWSAEGARELAYDHLFRLTPWVHAGRAGMGLSVVLLGLLLVRAPGNDGLAWRRGLLAAWIAWIALFAAASSAGALASARYESWYAGLWCVIAAAVVGTPKHRLLAVGAAVGLVVLAGWSTWKNVHALPTLEVEPWSDVAAELSVDLAHDDIVFVVPEWSAAPLRHYWPAAGDRIVALPGELFRARVEAADGTRQGPRPFARTDRRDVQKILDGRTRLWTVTTPTLYPAFREGADELPRVLHELGWTSGGVTAHRAVTVTRWTRVP